MDVAPDRDLFKFLDDLDKKDEGKSEIVDVIDSWTNTEGVSLEDKNEEKIEDVWTNIAVALDDWTQRILDTETRQTKSVSFQHKIEDSLHRQQLDGFLNHNDVAELRYVATLWTNLLNATSCYTIGCVFLKRDIITLLLELYTLK